MAIANPILNFVVRGFQALFGVVVLGISVSLIRGHHWGSLPASLGFSAFVGGVTILGAKNGELTPGCAKRTLLTDSFKRD